MKYYKQLTCEQRYQIEGLLKAEHTQTEIAVIVGVHKSTISREVRRNKGLRGYRPRQAQIKCDNRKCSKVESKFAVEDWALIERLLEQQWSPKQISLWLKQEGHLDISHGTIYQYILRDQATGGELHKQLRERKKKRKRYGGGKGRRGKIPHQTSIEERPAIAEHRDRPGADWEGDLIIGSMHKQAIVTMVDRCTRMTLMRKVAFKTAEAVTAAICEMMSSVNALFQPVTFDNGREFAMHEKIAAELGGQVYFTHPYSS